MFTDLKLSCFLGSCGGHLPSNYQQCDYNQLHARPREKYADALQSAPTARCPPQMKQVLGSSHYRAVYKLQTSLIFFS